MTEKRGAGTVAELVFALVDKMLGGQLYMLAELLGGEEDGLD